MRTLKQLYELLLSEFDNLHGDGICTKITHLRKKGLITSPENWSLYNDFLNRKPIPYFSKFWWNKSYTGKGYWWTCDEAGGEQRIRFIKHIIKSL